MLIQFRSEQSVGLQDSGAASVSAQLSADSQLARAAALVLGPGVLRRALQISERGGLGVFERDGQLQVFKLMNCRSHWRKRFARYFGWNPARRAVEQSQLLERAGIAVCPVTDSGAIPLPDAPKALWTIGRYFPDGITLRDYKKQLQPRRRSAAHPEIVRLYERGIDMLRGLHEAGFMHRDFHSGNLLVVPGDAQQLYLLDLDTVTRRTPSHDRRASELCRYVQNFVEPQNFEQVVLDAVARYAGGDQSILERLKRSRQVMALLREKGVLAKDILRGRQWKPPQGSEL